MFNWAKPIQIIRPSFEDIDREQNPEHQYGNNYYIQREYGNYAESRNSYEEYVYGPYGPYGPY